MVTVGIVGEITVTTATLLLPIDEDGVGKQCQLKAYRDALERISWALKMPGSPDLVADVAKEVERLLNKFLST